MCMYLCACPVFRFSRQPEAILVSLDLELWVIVSHQTFVLELGSSAKENTHFFFFKFLRQVYPCNSSSCPGICYGGQASLELTDILLINAWFSAT